MCGITGIIGKGWTQAELEAMVGIQSHRGPDNSDIYIDQTGTVGLGHNRLSIIDLSPDGHQPMKSVDGKLWLIFNGEVYNYRELRTELNDYPYRSVSDSEVILAAYQKWGERCVERFIGMFAIVIWDSEHQRLFCARDRLGIKPFHYGWRGDALLFGSEVKALLAAGCKAAPNWNTWSVYLTHGYYDHSDETFFEGVHTLPPGHSLTVERGVVSIRKYWDLPAIAGEKIDISDDEAAARLRDLVEDAVRLRLRSDVPLGVNLSGGLDSASLMMTVDRLLQTEGELQTFTASFDDSRYAEEEFASRVPRHTKWARHIQTLKVSDVQEVAWKALWHQEAPYGGIATLVYHHLHKLSRERGVTVLLEGQGVDEMLAGYNYFKPAHYLDLLEAGQMQELRTELRALNGSGKAMLNEIRRLKERSSSAVYQDGTSYLQPECLSSEIRERAGEAPTFERPFKDHLTNALYRDLRYTKLPRVLRMNDRLSMAFSRELRVPYLDHRIVEFLFKLPGRQKIRLGRSKYLLRHAMAGTLPDPIRLAQKRAVVTPQREWLRSELRPYVQEIIESRSFAERGIFNVPKVREAYSKFCQGEGDNAFFVWQWVNTELWFRRFIDGGTVG